MTMYVRFHRGQYVDAVVPSAVGIHPPAAPGDEVWSVSTDINPSKTIEVDEPVQAVDPTTGQPLFNADGTPVYETQTVTNPDGTTSEVVVTTPVSRTVYLWQGQYVDPTQFTMDDIESYCTANGLTFVEVGSIEEARSQKEQELRSAYQETLAAGFTSSADGTQRVYGFDNSPEHTDQQEFEQATLAYSTGNLQFPVEWRTKNGDLVELSETQFKQLIADATSFKQSQLANFRNKIAQVQAATTIDQVNAVTW